MRVQRALHAERDGSGPPIVLVHGFGQTRRCWGPLAEDLARDHEVVRVDAPGHGRSWALAAGLRDGAGLIAEVGGRAVYLGYSMGARFCLHVALGSPELVRGLVLIGGTAGIEDPGERAARRAEDRLTAELVRRQGVVDFVDGWLRRPLFASLPPERAFRAERSENVPEGLCSSLELAGTGAQEPLWDQLGRLEMPVLVTAGALDTRFAGLAERMAAAIGANATVSLIPDAGHAAHLEQPEAFVAVLRGWLTR